MVVWGVAVLSSVQLEWLTTVFSAAPPGNYTLENSMMERPCLLVGGRCFSFTPSPLWKGEIWVDGGASIEKTPPPIALPNVNIYALEIRVSFRPWSRP